MTFTHFPYFVSGIVVKGFGRGSKELGCPTANFAIDVVRSLPTKLSTGIYCGWACVDNEEIHKMVMSIGWNPFYGNKEKSMETYILHDFNRDFYGSVLKVCICAYIRPEQNFKSLNELIEAIEQDKRDTMEIMDRPEMLQYKSADFFGKKITNGS